MLGSTKYKPEVAFGSKGVKALRKPDLRKPASGQTGSDAASLHLRELAATRSRHFRKRGQVMNRPWNTWAPAP